MIDIVTAHSEVDFALAQNLASEFNLCFLTPETLDPDQLVLYVDGDQIGIGLFRKNKLYSSMQVDFLSGKNSHRKKNEEHGDSDFAQALAAKDSNPLRVLDCTTGLGNDSFAMASLGHTVIMVERHPIIHLLLQNGLQRASKDASTQKELARMTLLATDALALLSAPDCPQCDVCYLDPMYPSRKKSALVKKEMRWFRHIVGEDLDATQLLTLARQQASSHVVVKRMRTAEYLAECKPQSQIVGSKVRFDLYY